jgi:CMP-N-acetylneuraminic acid synthetase
LPRKNVQPLAGRPLIAHTIEAALSAPSLTRLIVSTEDPEVARVARACGAEVPFLRPAALAQDETPLYPVLTHAVAALAEAGWQGEWVVLLQPTSPLRRVEDIEAALDLARSRRADAVVSVTPAPRHPYWLKRLDAEGRLSPWLAEQANPPRRQDLPPVYVPNGAVYVARTDVLLSQQTFYTARTYGYIMPPERSLDIDSAWDLQLAECLLTRQLSVAGKT